MSVYSIQVCKSAYKPDVQKRKHTHNQEAKGAENTQQTAEFICELIEWLLFIGVLSLDGFELEQGHSER